MSSRAIKFKNISKIYGTVSVLSDFNLDITLNETTALVGESGSGKTTLLQIVNGLTMPSGGSVEIFGAKIDYIKDFSSCVKYQWVPDSVYNKNKTRCKNNYKSKSNFQKLYGNTYDSGC